MIVSDSGFSKDSNGPNYAELPLDANDDALSKLLDQSGLVISVSSFADGRAFSLAKRPRLLGYEGRIRLKGDLLPDQYGMARRSGIDDIEISDAPKPNDTKGATISLPGNRPELSRTK